MFDRILLGTDFTPTSSAAEDKAIALAKVHGSKIIALHVIEHVPFDDEDPTIAAFYSTLTTSAEDKMEAIAARCALDEIPYEGRVERGRRFEKILEVAHERNVDLIVMGARSSDPRARALATTAHKVFVMAQRPVLFVPEPFET